MSDEGTFCVPPRLMQARLKYARGDSSFLRIMQVKNCPLYFSLAHNAMLRRRNVFTSTTHFTTIPSTTVHMECAVSPANFVVPSPERSVTRARRLYVSRKANFHISDPIDRTVHIECAVSQDTSLNVPRPKPGTQCHTSATSLRKQK